ncbi:hypothetical protein C1280_11920 [Gemmata obscuriglobus]|uniref:Uncharacterized protein n=1 Tax=Gemmata obscuriglobus TaxID=114 RepID=A0A2Z3H972_9BACT|nr:hypothetical protein C1280_11920 [Gemmata obscuriglobus]
MCRRRGRLSPRSGGPRVLPPSIFGRWGRGSALCTWASVRACHRGCSWGWWSERWPPWPWRGAGSRFRHPRLTKSTPNPALHLTPPSDSGRIAHPMMAVQVSCSFGHPRSDWCLPTPF